MPEGAEKFIFMKKRSAVALLRSRKCITEHNWITYQFFGGAVIEVTLFAGDIWSAGLKVKEKCHTDPFSPFAAQNQRLLCPESLIRLQKVAAFCFY